MTVPSDLSVRLSAVEYDRVLRRLDEVTRSLSIVAKERDALRTEVEVLRTCVSTHLHGSPQELANAYARLRRFDSAKGLVAT